MTAKVIYNIGSHRVAKITGQEVFECRVGGQRNMEITAEDLRHYMGGDVAVPNLRLEGGAHAQRISDLPNAVEFKEGDRITGLQNGHNANFKIEHIIGPAIAAMSDIVHERVISAVETLPKDAVLGDEAIVIDGASGLQWGEPIRGGGDTPYKCWYNSRHWTVVGK